MPTDLQNYITQARATGKTDTQISQELSAAGWDANSIGEALTGVSTQTPVQPPATPPSSQPANPLPSTLEPSASPGALPQSAPPPSSKIGKLAIPIVVGVLLIGGGAYAYRYYFNPQAQLANKWVGSWRKIQSADFEGSLDITAPKASSIPGIGSGFNGGKFDFYGSFDTSDPASPKTDVNFDVKSGAESASAEIRFIDQIVYGRLKSVSGKDAASFGSFINKWFKLDIGALAATQGLGSKTVISSQLTPDEILQLQKALQKLLPKILSKVGSENINGVATDHYKVVFDKAAISQFLKDIRPIIQSKSGKQITDADIDTVLQAIDPAKLYKTYEFWVGQKDYYPYKFLLVINGEQGAEFKIAVTFKNYNQPVDIQVPVGAQSLNELLQGFMGGINRLPSSGNPANPYNPYGSLPNVPKPQLPSNYPSYPYYPGQ